MATTDRDSLVDIYNETGGLTWTRKGNWKTRTNLSKWYGVNVNDQGRVKRLLLGDNGLKGCIPVQVGDLSGLKKLSLSGNNLEGYIPTELGKLSKLKKLMLENNQLEGSIPEELGYLSKLKRLWLMNNQLSRSIPGRLGDLRRLMKLSLSNNRLSGFIPEQLGALTDLQELFLDYNELEGSIPEQLGDLTGLKILSLSDNRLSGNIPEQLGNLRELDHLLLNNNGLIGPIPEQLGAMRRLRVLNLENNMLSGSIPKQLGDLTELDELFLSNNKLEGTVPVSVWKLPRLTELDIASNLLTHLTDPKEQAASAREVLASMERLTSQDQAAPDCSQVASRLLCGCRPQGFSTSDDQWQSGLHTAGNPWEFPPAAVVAKGRESVRKYYDTWAQCDFILDEIHSLKLVLVGTYGAGKTSLVRSIKKGRGDRTPEENENKRTTVGVDLHSHKLNSKIECKIYDIAGQVTYYGLHQFFLTERAIYAIVWDATKFEGRTGNDLDKAIKGHILEWVSLLHMRTPVCTVMLVASHYDNLRGATRQDNERLLSTVRNRFETLHDRWKSRRDRENSSMDERMNILPGVFPVGCKLENESASYTTSDGLQPLIDALSSQTTIVSRVPPSWVAARGVLEQMGSPRRGHPGDAPASSNGHRPWQRRSIIYDKFEDFVKETRSKASRGVQPQHPASYLLHLGHDGIRDSMDGAIELRSFSGTLISHDVFVVLDVMWLAGVLKPILDHRGVTKNETGKNVFAGRILDEYHLNSWAQELVDTGVLRKGFARFLWNLTEHDTVGLGNSFEEILDEIGVTVPLPIDNRRSNAPDAIGETKLSGDVADHEFPEDSGDLLVIMRLPMEADGAMRGKLSDLRDMARKSLRAVFEFDHAGAPHGLPERVMALSHKIGEFSKAARWRHGGLFRLYGDDDSHSSSMMILEYDKEGRTFSIEALGQNALDFRAVRFVISALFHVACDFPGVNWTGWMECGMRHSEQKMFHLATSKDKHHHIPGCWVIPAIPNSPWDAPRKQRNLCGAQDLVSCTLDPFYFGRVLDIKQYYPRQADQLEGEERPSRCLEVYNVLRPLSGQIAAAFAGFAVGLFAAGTAVDDSKLGTLVTCYGFAVICVMVAVVALISFCTQKIADSRRRREESVNGFDQSDPDSRV